MKSDVLSHEEFLARLRAIGEKRYHDKHLDPLPRMNDRGAQPRTDWGAVLGQP